MDESCPFGLMIYIDLPIMIAADIIHEDSFEAQIEMTN